MARHPGKYLADIIKPELKKDFAARLGVSNFTLWKLLNERQRIEPRMAERLAKATGRDAAYWLKLQCDHDISRIGRRG